MRNRDEGVVYHSATAAQRRRRRTQAIVGTIGLAAVLGPTAYFFTAQIIDRRQHTVSQEARALAPVVPTEETTPEPTATRKSGGPPVRSTMSAVRRSTSPTPVPPTPSAPVDQISAQGLGINERSYTTAEGTIRVQSARFDLTGRQDLSMAGDSGRPFGTARCTQRMRFAGNADVRLVPSMLLCWRVSPERSVVTMAVAAADRPDPARNLQLIDQEWAKLG